MLNIADEEYGMTLNEIKTKILKIKADFDEIYNSWEVVNDIMMKIDPSLADEKLEAEFKNIRDLLNDECEKY